MEMNTRRTPARSVGENDVNEKIPPQVEKDPQGAQTAQGARDVQVSIVEGGKRFRYFPRLWIMGILERISSP